MQSQFRTAHGTFYYGGTNPTVRTSAAVDAECFYNGRLTYVGAYGVGYLHRNLVGRPTEYVVSDCAPYRNAVVYGYTAVDARNEAYANVPTFFRMADLQSAAVPSPDDRGVVVPAQAPGTIDIRPTSHREARTRPATEARPILIIPKKALEPQKKPDGVMARASD